MCDNLNWVKTVPTQMVKFLENQRSFSRPGYYSYSETGDLFDEKIHWNVGATCYALKIYYTLGFEKGVEIDEALAYILSFRQGSSSIYDPFIVKRSFARNILSSIKHQRYNNFFHQNYKRAETRQCLSALALYDAIPKDFDIACPVSKHDVESFLSQQNWNVPWAAGSHFSHILFFLNKKYKLGQISKNEYQLAKASAYEWISKIQSPEHGGWAIGKQDSRSVINGAMKIMTGFQNINYDDYPYKEKLIDTCLSSINDGHACDNFNIVYVLNKLSQSLEHSHRYEEICDFLESRISLYRQHYKEDSGGFSFFPNSTNKNYYGLDIAKGKNEADIHGSVLFLWGLCLISDTLGISTKQQLREFVS